MSTDKCSCIVVITSQASRDFTLGMKFSGKCLAMPMSVSLRRQGVKYMVLV